MRWWHWFYACTIQIMAMSNFEFSAAQFSHCIVPGQADLWLPSLVQGTDNFCTCHLKNEIFKILLLRNFFTQSLDIVASAITLWSSTEVI
jgi:hypothetical protein